MGELARLLKEYSHVSKERMSKETSRELQLSTNIDKLVQEEYLKTAVKGAEEAAFMRKLFPVLKTISNRPKISYLKSERYGTHSAYIAQAPIFKDEVVSREAKIGKVWTLPLAPEELIADGDWDLIEWEVKKAGASIEHTLNRDMLVQLIDNATYSVQDASGDPDYFIDAYDTLATQKKNPNVAILHPKYYAALLKSGLQNWPELPGPEIWVLNETSDGTKTWGYSSNDDVGGVLIDISRAGVIAMKTDITIEKYEEPLHDLRGAIVYARFGVTYLDPDSICVIYK
ncbi:MAG: hypothetical protein KAX49_16600 [Halanaerobiales bacterium]|nr:hypothetical protein [Halanaerobiales bacterium]